MHLFIRSFSWKYDRYRDYVPVYTDGTRDGNYLACATVFPSNTVISMRLTDSAFIFTAEIWAMIKGMEEGKKFSCIPIQCFYRLTFVFPCFTMYEAGTFLD